MGDEFWIFLVFDFYCEKGDIWFIDIIVIFYKIKLSFDFEFVVNYVVDIVF